MAKTGSILMLALSLALFVSCNGKAGNSKSNTTEKTTEISAEEPLELGMLAEEEEEDMIMPVEQAPTYYNLVGKVAGSDVHMSMELDNGNVMGRYYYDSQSKKASSSSMKFYGEYNGAHMIFTEFYSDKPTGIFDGYWADELFKGTFTRAKDGKTFDFNLTSVYSDIFPGGGEAFFEEFDDFGFEIPIFERSNPTQGQPIAQQKSDDASLGQALNDRKNNSYNVVLKKENSLLSEISLQELPTIKNLTVTGPIGKADLTLIFDKCVDLEYLDLKNTTLKGCRIEEFDFSKTTKLKDFKMPSNIKELYVSAHSQSMHEYGPLFYNCPNLESVELPSSLEIVQCNLFVNCPKIQTITFPQSIRELACDIQDCQSLTTIDLSRITGLPTNSMGAFYRLFNIINCPNIKTIKYEQGRTRGFGPSGEPESGVTYYFGQNQVRVGRYKNCVLYFQNEATNTDKSVKYCTIHYPKSLQTLFYVEFGDSENHNTLIPE